MKCPACSADIPDVLLARHLAAKGGRAVVRRYRPSSEKAREMAELSHEARKRKVAKDAD